MKSYGCSVLLFLLLVTQHGVAQNAAEGWTSSETNKWFNKKEWLNGAHVKPHASINKKEFVRQYHLNKALWDTAFAFLKDHDLDSLPVGKYPIDGDDVIASVTEQPTRDLEKSNWESHRKFIDIQCVISGEEEKMGVCPVSEAVVSKEYDDLKDLLNYTATGTYYVAGPGTFFILFPAEAHRPNITPGGYKVVKKIVIKVRVAA